jgi:hypothetical protein
LRIQTYATSRPGIGAAGAAAAIFIVIILAGLLFVYFPPAQSTIKLPTPSSSSSSGQSIISLLGGYASASVSSATLNIFTLQNGQYVQTIDSPGTVTSGTATSATTNTYSPPWLTQCRGSGVWPFDVVTSGAGQTVTQNGQTVFTLTSGVPASASNAVSVYKQTCLLFAAPASGTTADTNVESVVNSQTGQTNSFPTDFPATAPSTWNVYLQVFSDNAVGLATSTIYGTSNKMITDYAAGAVQTASQPVTFGSYLIAAFNQTGISVTSADGAVALSANKASGTSAYLIPVPGCAPAPSTGVSTSNPDICGNVPITVQETVTQGTHHVDAVFIWVTETQASYIESYYSSPAAGSFPAAGNAAGIPTGFGGLVPPSSANAPSALVEQYSAGISVY